MDRGFGYALMLVQAKLDEKAGVQLDQSGQKCPRKSNGKVTFSTMSFHLRNGGKSSS